MDLFFLVLNSSGIANYLTLIGEYLIDFQSEIKFTSNVLTKITRFWRNGSGQDYSFGGGHQQRGYQINWNDCRE